MPTFGPPGSTATISVVSTSFPIGGQYRLRWSRSASFENEDDIQLLVEGENPRDSYNIVVSFTVPEAGYGTNYLQLLRYGSDDVISLQYSVKPVLIVEPAAARVGDTLNIRGMGFPMKTDGTVVLDGLEPGLDFTSNEAGSFTLEIKLSEKIAGEHKLVANSPGIFADTALATFLVEPVITLMPQKPQVGSTAVLSGSGFAARSQLSIVYNGVQLEDAPATDEKGVFTHTFTITQGSPEEQKIVVTDAAGNIARYGMPLETTLPPKPQIVSPRDKGQTFGFIGTELITFTWSPVEDPSGVTYILEVGENLEFFPLQPGMRKIGLAETSWALEVPPGTYFWRVKAVDGAGNEGEWAVSPNFFKVGVISIWYLIIGGIVILLVFILLVRAFIKRLKDYYG